ncbi:MAG: ABC transporter permease [Alphaproteobacteria bacterium]|nr:ABC transporter permease [Alphaproteobacteria bacterium]
MSVLRLGRLANRRNPLSLVLLYRVALWRTTLSEVRQRYAGSVMGLFWLAIAPALLMCLYATTFVFIFKVKPAGMEIGAYLLQMFAGLLPLLGFSEALLSGSGSLTANRAVLLNTVYPAELVSLRMVLSSHAATTLGLALLMAATVIMGYGSPALLLLPVVLALQIMFTTGLTWPLSLASLVLRDIQQVLAFLCTALMIASPIAYTIDSAPGPLRLLVLMNPLSYFILTFQSLVVRGILPGPKITAACLVLSFGMFFLGFRLFQRGKLAFWDYA